MAKELRTIEKITLKLVAVLAFAGSALAGVIWSSGQAPAKSDVAAPVTLPLDYRDWRLVSVAHEAES